MNTIDKPVSKNIDDLVQLMIANKRQAKIDNEKFVKSPRFSELQQKFNNIKNIVD